MKNNDALLSNQQAADWLGVSPRTVERWRLTGEGPRFVRLGRKTVRYRPEDLLTFVSEATRCNTGDQGEAR